jgi:hypothetical protein
MMKYNITLMNIQVLEGLWNLLTLDSTVLKKDSVSWS